MKPRPPDRFLGAYCQTGGRGQTHKDSCRSTHKRLKDQGRYTGGAVPWGKHIVKRKGTRFRYKKGESVPVNGTLRYVEWDPVECAQILELVARRRAGESFPDIARDWKARGMTRACGKPWVTMWGDRKQYITHQTIHNVYHWAEKQLRTNDGKLNGLSVPEPCFRALPRVPEMPEDPLH